MITKRQIQNWYPCHTTTAADYLRAFGKYAAMNMSTVTINDLPLSEEDKP